MTIRNGRDIEGGALMVDFHSIAGVYDSALIGNRAVDGGAVAVDHARLTVLRSLFSSNIAESNGGGIYHVGDPSDLVTITSSTFTANSALVGGAINNAASTLLINATVSENAGTGGASSISNAKGASLKVLNTIIGRDIGQPSTALSGQFESLGNNIVTDASNSSGFVNGVNQDQVSDGNAIDPMIGSLANNGGPTDTMAVLPGSPAVDNGNPCAVRGTCSQLPGVFIRDTMDQRGYLRASLFGATPEVGAFEQVDLVVVRFGTAGIHVSPSQYPVDRLVAVLTNARTLEKRRTRFDANGNATFPSVRTDDDYVIEVNLGRKKISVAVFAFD